MAIERTFGKRIGGSKFDIRNPHLLEDMESLSPEKQIATLTKKNIFKEPKWLDLLEEDTLQERIDLMRLKQFYRGITEKAGRMVSPIVFMKVVMKIKEMFESGELLTELKRISEDIQEIKKNNGKIKYRDLFQPLEDKLRNEVPEAKLFFLEYLFNEKHAHGSARMAVLSDKELESCLDITGFPEENPANKYFGFFVRKNAENNFTLQQEAWAWYRMPYETEALAIEKAQDIMDISKTARSPRKKTIEITRPHCCDEERRGPEYHTGNVTTDMFLEEFGFYGGEFGEWVTDKERQEILNTGYDALCDLADALKIPHKAIGLYGNIAAAFASRGKGKAAAHYEHDRKVFNLTKRSGAGAMAHEWAHALDHNAKELSYEKPFHFIYDSTFADEGSGLDRGKPKRYYSKPTELFARAMEAYIHDALLKQDRVSPFLVYGVTNDYYDGLKPYPEGTEREVFFENFSKIPFNEIIETRVQKQTNVEEPELGNGY